MVKVTSASESNSNPLVFLLLRILTLAAKESNLVSESDSVKATDSDRKSGNYF